MVDELTGRRVTVMGLGRLGGGLGVTRWLAGQGAEVLVTDTAPESALARPLADLAAEIAGGRVTLRLGEHRREDFTACDLVVANPAVPRPWENAYLAAAAEAGVPITTEIGLLVARLDRQRVIGITGTAGKSTTSAMIRHALAGCGCEAHLGGNIGGSLLPQLETFGPDAWIVLELSSAMLHWLAEGGGWSPHVAVMTNFAPNHVDWHGTLEHYRRSKLHLFGFQSPGDHRLDGPPEPPAPAIDLCVPGAHNQRNAQLAVAAVVKATGVDPARAGATLADFRGLPHRLRLIEDDAGRRFYDDSKSTTPGATLIAVDAFDDASTIHLIAGGYDKGVDLDPIAGRAASLGGLYTIGATGPALAAAADGHARHCSTLESAVAQAASRMGPRDVLLLSPGCASWDQFENFEERGAVFAAAVRAAIVRGALTPGVQ